VIPDLDIHRSAWLMIRRYGDDAEAQAAMRGDELLDKGDLDGMLVWMAIISAIRRLQATTPAGGEALALIPDADIWRGTFTAPWDWRHGRR
jgi:hypothetical protein